MPIKHQFSCRTYNEIHKLAGLPVVGEYLTLNSSSSLYQVQHIADTPSKCDYEAEVYAVEVDHEEAKTGCPNRLNILEDENPKSDDVQETNGRASIVQKIKYVGSQ